MEKFKCCICELECNGWGNSPWGAIKVENDQVVEMEFKDNDRCCDMCNNMYVIPGRIWHMRKR